jgi:tensin
MRRSYLIWNLSETVYDYSPLHEQVIELSFPGYPSPPLGALFKICISLDSWLNSDPSNLALVHCRVGMGRTSTVVAAYLAWSGRFPSVWNGLQHVCDKQHVPIGRITIPSQRRYLQYFSFLMDG